ncbi:nicotinate phosphoribosyltransferase [Pseudomonas sp.]|uniref:nicotinate phosphoribosyltransferase n=1 Tax=Pseudomonas sp. TaxID=306 RepID=UPI003FD8A82C
MKLNAATVTDGYKVAHGSMYADGTTKVYSNLTPRSDKIYARNAIEFYDGNLVFVGAQGAVQEIKELWDDSFFSKPKEKVIGEYATRMAGYLGGEVAATQQLSDLHDIGYLPLVFKALPEGSLVPMGVPVITITNTLPSAFWLVNYLETVISNLTWKTAANATIAREYKKICQHFATLTGTDDFTVSIQCHDFSERGMSGPEDAARSGFAHLTSFIGTDTLPAMDYAEDYYDATGLIAISVPATEHAVATNNILSIEQGLNHDHNTRLDAERIFMNNLITQKYPKGIVSYVADSFDFWSVLTDILPSLKEVIINREASNVAPGKLVIRPDSGDPVKVVCGDEEAEVGSAEYKGAIEVLWETFNGTITDKGYKLLDSHIGLIYGDSITTKRALEILTRLEKKGFASGNVVFGVGSYTYQCNTRDTFGMALKATYSIVNGKPVNIFKDPKTDSKKKSAKGLLKVEKDIDGKFILIDQVSEQLETEGELKTIFENGVLLNRVTLDTIRARLS